MDAFRMTMLMQVTTDAGQTQDANRHSGGFSESIWANVPTDISQNSVQNLLVARARLLPKQASIIGIRVAHYTFALNKLLPGATSSAKQLIPGNVQYNCNLPQDALQMDARAAGTANSRRFALKCLPDEQVVQGEYQPDGDYRGYLATFMNLLSTGGWYFVARDLSLPSYRVLSVTGAGTTMTVFTQGPPVGFGTGDPVRFRRTKFDDGTVLKQAVFVLGVSATGFTFGHATTLNLISPSGTVRKDLLTLPRITGATPVRAVVRKIGGPFEKYRGRASKRRAS